MSTVWIEPLCLQNRASSRKVSERVIDLSDKTAYFYYSSIHQTNKVLLETPRFFTLNNIVTWTFCMKWIRRSDFTKNYIAFLIFITGAGVSFIRSVFFFIYIFSCFSSNLWTPEKMYIWNIYELNCCVECFYLLS